MNFFILQQVNGINIDYIFKHLHFYTTQHAASQVQASQVQASILNQVVINKTLFKYLKKVKTQIDNCQMQWDKYKKYTNPYEYIHTVIPNAKQSVCSLKPLSRSFYKMIEISTTLNILEDLRQKKECKTFHLAEGPGGFIEAIVKMRNNPNDVYYGMTLLNSQDINVPGWNKSKYFLETNSNVIIEKGLDGKGDLMNPENLLDCYIRFQNTMDLITGDGGFDFSYDFNNQESECSKLILCQIFFAIAMQKTGGTFIVKFFDTFTRVSIEMLYLLSTMYEEVFFIKPNTSRRANSEKYIVCKKFRAINNIDIKKMYSIMQEMQKESLIGLLDIEVPYIFWNKIEEYNAIFGQQQLENIHLTLQLISQDNKRDNLENMKKTNIQKSIHWCQKYNFPYNKSISSSNIFLPLNLKI